MRGARGGRGSAGTTAVGSRRARQEDRAERDPDVPGLERPAAECAAAAARHLPRDLRPGPGLGDAPGQVLDRHERDLPRLARPRLHDPGLRFGPEVGGRRRVGRVALEPARDLRVGECELRRLLLGQARDLGAVRREGSRDEREGRDERGRRQASVAAPERPELVADEVHRRDEDDRDRLRKNLARPDLDEERGARRGSHRARESRRRGSVRPGTRRGRAAPGRSRVGSTCSCSSPRRGTSRSPPAGSAARSPARGSEKTARLTT